MMSRWSKAIAGGLLITMVLHICGFAANCAVIRRDVVRIHILAHSDSEADQALKLQVRDRVVATGDGLLNSVTDPLEARAKIEQALPQLQAAAQQCVYEAGYTYPVTAEMAPTYFTTRVYEAGTFPAGYYEAVRFTIGDGKGKNWWCVMYPPLCIAAATDKSTLSDVLTDGQTHIIQNAERYQVRFKVVEWLERLMTVFRA